MTAQNPKSNDTDKTQIDRFKEAARQIGCDEDEAAFDTKLKGLAKQKLDPKEPQKAGT